MSRHLKYAKLVALKVRKTANCTGIHSAIYDNCLSKSWLLATLHPRKKRNPKPKPKPKKKKKEKRKERETVKAFIKQISNIYLEH